MPTVDGKKFSYTPAGERAAARARKLPKAAPTAAPKTKSSLMGKGYNITKNLGETPDAGY